MVKQNYPKDFYVGNFRKVGTELLPKIFFVDGFTKVVENNLGGKDSERLNPTDESDIIF